jgi:hypothetical protein
MSWAQDEFKTLELGDQRLNARAVLLAERLSSKPTESIPNACLGWAETQGAYRFLSNPRRRGAADCEIGRLSVQKGRWRAWGQDTVAGAA